MMTTEQVLAFQKNLHANEETEPETTTANVDEGEVQETKTVEVTEETKDTVSEEENKPEVTETSPVEEQKEKPIEDSNNQAKSEKHKYTKQEQIDYAFQKKQAKIKKLEARVRELEEREKERKNLTIEDFNNKVDDYVNYAVDKKDAEREKNRLVEELSDYKKEEFDAIQKERVSRCFPDENDRDSYNKLLAEHGKDFLKIVDRDDPDEVVLGFLDDSDVSPILLRLLMTSKTHRDMVLSKHSPYAKQRAMETLENSVKFAMAKLAKQRNSVPEKTEETKPEKPAMPIIGSVTKTDKISGEVVKDYNDILHKLNERRKYST